YRENGFAPAHFLVWRRCNSTRAARAASHFLRRRAGGVSPLVSCCNRGLTLPLASLYLAAADDRRYDDGRRMSQRPWSKEQRTGMNADPRPWAARKRALGQQLLQSLYEKRLFRTWLRDRPEGWELVSGVWSPFYIQLRHVPSYPALLA